LAGLHLGHEALLGFEAAAGAHGLEHFAHLGVLAEEVVDLLDGGSGAAGDALAAATVDDLVVASAFLRVLEVLRREPLGEGQGYFRPFAIFLEPTFNIPQIGRHGCE